MNKSDKQYLFSLLVSVLTLAVITVGTTYAFFTSVIKRENAIKTSSANIKLNLDVRALYNQNEIIPTNDNDIIKAVNNECTDIYGYGACYAYTIKVTSEGDPQDVITKFKVKDNEIPNLKYMLLDADNKDKDGNYVVYKDVSYTKLEYEKMGEHFHLNTGEDKNFILVLWLSNIDSDQKEEEQKTFYGSITVESTLGTKITGTINDIIE